MKIIVNKEEIWYWLIVITPIIDTINGLFLYIKGVTVAQGATDSASVGTVYRALVMVVIFILFYQDGLSKKAFMLLLCMMYFPLKALVAGTADGAFFSYFSYALKWIYPVLIVSAYCQVYRKDLKRGRYYLEKIMGFFVWMFPLLLIAEFILKLGRATYYDAGFKGLFYSTNDISYCLTVAIIYEMFIFLGGYSLKHMLCIALNFAALIILSTKSGIVFAGIALLYALYCHGLFSIRKMAYLLMVIAAGAAGLFLICLYFNSEIQSMLHRYTYMFEHAMGRNHTIAGLLLFLTTGRTGRIQSFFSALQSCDMPAFRFLVGWIRPDNATVIEMDFHDLLCQYGLIGLSALGAYYLNIYLRGSSEKKYRFMYAISLISAGLGGHIISGALSGTVFSVVVCFLLSGLGEGYGRV